MKHYICHHSGGSFDFYADSKQLAIDHAQYACGHLGVKFQSIAKL